MFFGWGRTSRHWPVGNGAVLICSYRYVHIWWVFQLAFGERWLLAGDQRSQDRQLSPAELQQMFPDGAPQLGVWRKYGLLIGIAVLVVFAIIAGAT